MVVQNEEFTTEDTTRPLAGTTVELVKEALLFG
jgi:hypothetical protein